MTAVTAGRLGDLAADGDPRLAACLAALRARGLPDDVPACAFLVPGRIEVLGKHTDYAGGRSLLCATEQGFAIVAVPRGDARVRLVDAASGDEAALALDGAGEAAGWANYAATATRRLARNFPAARTGAHLAFASDLPPAAGMSSSSALIVATFLALAAVNRLEEDARHGALFGDAGTLAAYLACVENGQDFGALAGDAGVGTQGGSEDHTAILCGRPGALVQYRFAPVRLERAIAMPAGYGFVVASSGVRAEKTGAARDAYNRVAERMRTAAALWRQATGRDDATIGAALDADPAFAERLPAIIADAPLPREERRRLADRVAQFVLEHRELVPAAGDALARGDLPAFGRLVASSHAAAARLLGNQVGETEALERLARELGAVAASAFGAGFGGSVWALVADADAEHLVERWRDAYLAAFPAHAADARFLRTTAASPATRLL